MLSIIIPTLNEEILLPNLLRSIKKQRYRGYEVIVADAGSTDKTREIAKRAGCKIREGGLPAKGRNEGAKGAKGELLFFLDADTELPPKFLPRFLHAFERKQLDVAGCSLRIRSPKKIYRLIEKLYDLYFHVTEKFYPHATNCILIKKTLHKAIGGFDEKVFLGEDFLYVREAAKKGKFGFIPEVFFYASPRRAEEGMLKVAVQYFLAEAHMTFVGPIRSNLFKYRFSHSSPNSNAQNKTNLS